MKNTQTTPHTQRLTGYVAKPKMTTKRYIRIEGSLQDKFPQISEDIFVVGKYMFVPEELFEKTLL